MGGVLEVIRRVPGPYHRGMTDAEIALLIKVQRASLCGIRSPLAFQPIPVGSRLICRAVPGDAADFDYLVLHDVASDPDPAVWIEKVCGCPPDSAGSFVSDFTSVRYGRINFIVAHTPMFYRNFLLATELALFLDLENKNDRLAAYDAIILGSIKEERYHEQRRQRSKPFINNADPF